MGIFDKKSGRRKKEEFDSPVEMIDLDAQSASPQSSAAPSTSQSSSSHSVVAAMPEPEPVRRAPEPKQDYGIEQAIALMRTLPTDSVELVVRVVKQTLESTNIDIPAIIKDATAKEGRINARISDLSSEISTLEHDIADRKSEIELLEADNKETALVKERLELAENLGNPGAKKKQNTSTNMPSVKSSNSTNSVSSTSGGTATSGQTGTSKSPRAQSVAKSTSQQSLGKR